VTVKELLKKWGYMEKVKPFQYGPDTGSTKPIVSKLDELSERVNNLIEHTEKLERLLSTTQQAIISLNEKIMAQSAKPAKSGDR
jgi:hypothetical protein